MRRPLAALLGLFFLSFGLAVACLGTEPRSLTRAVNVARIDDGGAQWQAALAQYPALTVVLFALYSNQPAFQSMLHDWGHNTTFPVIGRCFPGTETHPDETIPSAGSAEAACGRQVIGKINTYGYSYLRQFAIDKNGVAHRLIVPTAASAIEDVLTGGIETVERKHAAGQPVALRDWGEAGLDVAQVPLLVAAGASIAERGAARIGTTASYETTGRSAFTGAIARAATSGWVWKTGGVLTVGYVAIRHPAVITALGGYAARLIGLPAWVGQGLVWATGAVALCAVLWPVACVLMLLGRGGRVGYWILRERAAP